MIEIQLTRGYVAIVDDCDADLAEFKWFASKYGYAIRNLPTKDGRRGTVFLHGLVIERKLGHPLEKGQFCDHIHGNKMDNRRSELRVVTRAQNQYNQKRQRNNTSGFKGVSFHKASSMWRAVIAVNGKPLHIGSFTTPEKAHEAYCEAARKHYGEFARFE